MKYEMQIKNGLAKERNNGAFGTRLMDSQSAAPRRTTFHVARGENFPGTKTGT